MANRARVVRSSKQSHRTSPLTFRSRLSFDRNLLKILLTLSANDAEHRHEFIAPDYDSRAPATLNQAIQLVVVEAGLKVEVLLQFPWTCPFFFVASRAFICRLLSHG